MSDVEKVKKLRKSTGAGFKDCNSALKESKGDLEKAIEILRIKGVSKATKKMTRDANEGVVALSGDENQTSVIEVNCETDFVAKNQDFINFVKELSEINNKCLSEIEKVKLHVMRNGKSVEENIVSLISKIGEKITIGRTKTINNSGSKNFTYLHSVVKDNLSKLAVITSIETKEKNEKVDLFGKQLTMHVAASNPLAIDSDKLDKNIIANEQKIISEELKNLGKTEDVAKKNSLGKINKFKQDNSLLTQDWVMEPKKKVKEIISELNISDLKVKEFYRLKIGE